MSRWYITSSQTADREARSASRRSHLHPSGQLKGAGLYGEAYFKRVLSTVNVLPAGEDWVCAAGTILYQGQMGEFALQRANADFLAGGAAAVQKNALGHYAIAIKRGNRITVFTDPQGSLNLYYLRDGETWFVSNALDICATALRAPRIDATKLLVAAVQTNLPGEDTFFRGVKRLFGTQQIQIDLTTHEFAVENLPQPASSLQWGFQRIEDALAQYKGEVRAVFHELSGVGPIGLFGTGGLDSRTILSALLDQEASVQLMYGVGNTKLSDYDLGDLDVVQQIAKRYHLPFQQLDWAGTQPYEERKLQELFRIYGFKYEIYGAPDSFLRTFNGEIFSYPQLFMGGYSPAFTNSKPWEWPRKSYHFDDLVATAMQTSKGPIENNECIADVESYKAAFSNEVRIALDRAGFVFPASGVSLETFVRAKLFLYIRAESRFLNFVNEFGHYIAPFLMKRLYDPLVSIPFQFRANDEFQLRLIHALTPSLVEIPLFSGWSPAHVDVNTFRLVRDNRMIKKKSFVRRAASRAVPSVMRTQARKVYSLLARSNDKKPATIAPRDASIVDVYGRAVLSDPLGNRWFRSMTGFSPKELARIRHYLVAVNELGYSE